MTLEEFVAMLRGGFLGMTGAMFAIKVFNVIPEWYSVIIAFAVAILLGEFEYYLQGKRLQDRQEVDADNKNKG